jgi:hypothetical protein
MRRRTRTPGSCPRRTSWGSRLGCTNTLARRACAPPRTRHPYTPGKTSTPRDGRALHASESGLCAGPRVQLAANYTPVRRGHVCRAAPGPRTARWGHTARRPPHETPRSGRRGSGSRCSGRRGRTPARRGAPGLDTESYGLVGAPQRAAVPLPLGPAQLRTAQHSTGAAQHSTNRVVRQRL